MRFYLASADRARSAAKSLLRKLSDLGVEASLGQCQAAIAAALGYASWAELKGQVGLHPPSSFDHEVGDEARTSRIAHQAKALAEAFSLSPDAAEAMARMAGLTSSRLAGEVKPVGGMSIVPGFLAGCSAVVVTHAGGTSVVAAMGSASSHSMRFEALFGTEGERPSLAFGIWPMSAAKAADPTPRSREIEFAADDIWLGGFQVLGFAAGREEGFYLRNALRRFKGSPPTDAEFEEAVAGWRTLLREAGVRALDALIDDGALALFAHASSPPMNLREAYNGLRDIPGHARIRSLLAAFPMLAHQIWLDPSIRDEGGPATPEALVGHIVGHGLDCGPLGRTGPLPRSLVETLRGETGGGAPWTNVTAMATLRLAHARGGDGWRWLSGERLRGYVTLAMTFRTLDLLWDDASVLEWIGRERLDRLLDGPPWRPVEACQAVLDQPDMERIPDEVSTALAQAAIVMSGHSLPLSRSPRLDPRRHGAALLELLDAGTLDKALLRSLLVIARAGLGRETASVALA